MAVPLHQEMPRNRNHPVGVPSPRPASARPRWLWTSLSRGRSAACWRGVEIRRCQHAPLNSGDEFSGKSLRLSWPFEMLCGEALYLKPWFWCPKRSINLLCRQGPTRLSMTFLRTAAAQWRESGARARDQRRRFANCCTQWGTATACTAASFRASRIWSSQAGAKLLRSEAASGTDARSATVASASPRPGPNTGGRSSRATGDAMRGTLRL